MQQKANSPSKLQITLGNRNEVDSSIPQISLIYRDEVDSTNDELRRVLQDEPYTAQGGIKAVMARRQTSGKGRLGRNWASPPGSLYLSLALELQEQVPGESALSLVVALGVREQLAACLDRGGAGAGEQPAAHPEQGGAGARDVQLKWPNDIICEQGKLCGILIELVPLPSGRRAAIVGIGINIERPKEGAWETAAYLSDLQGGTPELEQLAQEITERVKIHYLRWLQANRSFAAYTDEYNANLATKGKRVTVRDGSASVVAAGRVRGVDANGCLLVEDEQGRQTRVVAGEVTLRT